MSPRAITALLLVMGSEDCSIIVNSKLRCASQYSAETHINFAMQSVAWA